MSPIREVQGKLIGRNCYFMAFLAIEVGLGGREWRESSYPQTLSFL